jgi:hypothetical protein
MSNGISLAPGPGTLDVQVLDPEITWEEFMFQNIEEDNPYDISAFAHRDCEDSEGDSDACSTGCSCSVSCTSSGGC